MEIEIRNCETIELGFLKKSYDSKDFYNKDMLYKSKDNKFLILIHSIREGSMLAYYSQIIIFENSVQQDLIFKMDKSWCPLWVKNFHYLPTLEYFICPLTCYEKETKENPFPNLILDLELKKYDILKKEDDLKELNIFSLDWKDIVQDLDYCKLFKKKIAL